LSEQIVTSILILICFGQVWAVLQSRTTAVLYYFCVAPLGYFSIWQFGTLDPARLCGGLLIIGALFRFGRPEGIVPINRHAFFYFSLYVICVTIIGLFFWPTESVSGRSLVYSTLRPVVQIINWLIIAGVAWQIAIVVSVPENFQKIRKLVIMIGVLHSFYALYQIVAFYAGFPVTGIRRPYSEIGTAYDVVQYGLDNYFGVILYRVNSLVGEPKTFGTMSLVWIGLLMSLFLESKQDKSSIWKMLLFLVVLLLTYSTVAITGTLISISLFLLLSIYNNKLGVWSFIVWVFALGVGMFVLGKYNALGLGTGSLLEIFSERTIQSWQSILIFGPSDLPEVESLEILKERPWLIWFGTGLGGISFYIAQNIGGSDIILAPNTGLLSFICSIGIVGILFMIIIFRRSLLLPFTLTDSVDKAVKSLAFVGLCLFLQCFIFSAGILPFAFAFLLAADFMARNEQHPATTEE